MEFDTFFAREGRAKKLYPVIHVRTQEQAAHNMHIAFGNGADGVFLINHTPNSDILLFIADALRRAWPRSFIGINPLDRSAPHAFVDITSQNRQLSALWVDDPGIDDHVWSFAERLYERMQASTWPGYYFASVAFKGGRPVSDCSLVAVAASEMAHVVVTSGDRTGSPPSVDKIRAMKEAIPNHPLAIASGMTCDNIYEFLPHADIFMVATGISDKDDNLNPSLVNHMATIIQNYNKSAELLL